MAILYLFGCIHDSFSRRHRHMPNWISCSSYKCVFRYVKSQLFEVSQSLRGTHMLIVLPRPSNVVFLPKIVNITIITLGTNRARLHDLLLHDSLCSRAKDLTAN